MAKSKYTIDDFKDRWTSPIVSDWKPPKQEKKVKKTEKKKTEKK